MAERRKTPIFGVDITADGEKERPKQGTATPEPEQKKEEKKEKKKGTTQFFGG